MRSLLSTSAIVAVLLATSAIRPADARHVSSAHQSGCDVQQAEGGCASVSVSVSASAERVRSSRTARSRRGGAARRDAAGCGGSLSLIRAASGATACIAHSAAGAFQGFVSALEATGYRIDFMGGWRAHGSCRQCNMHPRGLALDINQTGRNRVTRRLPSGVTALAAHYGLLHGAVWSNADAGHFELLSESPTRFAYASADGGVVSRRGRHQVAALGAVHTDGAGLQGSGYQ
jgi:hypothetical protein